MVIGSKELSSSPGPVMQRVWEFLEVRSVPSNYTTEQLNAAYVGRRNGAPQAWSLRLHSP